ncbi:glycine, alanine and asparagine-rich protein-like [Penaeus chinensis]|uniref:glycine, alanine and asparagine-rich protein-like n=1 Tax=Penaeus chinensis TaxID=139456 RepID=UPI001FB68131|nr:glycine, alanine and asparagine-rich protein-like [Penaeus chinensis]
MKGDSQSLAPPGEGGGSRAGSPDPSGRRSPSSGRTSPSNLDEKAKSIINQTSDTDKVMEQYVGQDGEEGKGKAGNNGGGGGSNGGGGSGGSDLGAPSAPHPRPKAPVEDRALQAILAARRRSLENAGKPEPVGGGVDGWRTY